MSDVTRTSAEIHLDYYSGTDEPDRGIFVHRPVEPEDTAELVIGVYIDDDSIGSPPELKGKQIQIDFSGSARALESLGTYLIALARLESRDPDPHEHFEDVQNAEGGNIHLIIRRRS